MLESALQKLKLISEKYSSKSALGKLALPDLDCESTGLSLMDVGLCLQLQIIIRSVSR